MNVVELKAELRNSYGKKVTKQIRKAGKIPAVLYGSEDNVSFTVEPLDVRHIVYTSDFNVVEIQVGDVAHKCIVKDIDFHPVTDEILHMDFLKLEEGRKVKVYLPIRFKGTSPGVKEGGKLQQLLRTLHVKTTPDKLIDEVLVDLSTLKLGNSLKIKDIELPEGLEVLQNLNIPVVSVITPRAMKSKAAKEAPLPGEEDEASEEDGAAE